MCAAATFSTTAVSTAQDVVYQLPDSGMKDLLIHAMSIRLVADLCKRNLWSNGAIRWVEFDWDTDGLVPVAFETRRSERLTEDEVERVVDENATVFATNITNPRLVGMFGSPDGPLVLDLHALPDADLFKWSTLASDPFVTDRTNWGSIEGGGGGECQLLFALVQTMFPGDGLERPSEAERSVAESLAGEPIEWLWPEGTYLPTFASEWRNRAFLRSQLKRRLVRMLKP